MHDHEHGHVNEYGTAEAMTPTPTPSRGRDPMGALLDAATRVDDTTPCTVTLPRYVMRDVAALALNAGAAIAGNVRRDPLDRTGTVRAATFDLMDAAANRDPAEQLAAEAILARQHRDGEGPYADPVTAAAWAAGEAFALANVAEYGPLDEWTEERYNATEAAVEAAYREQADAAGAIAAAFGNVVAAADALADRRPR